MLNVLQIALWKHGPMKGLRRAPDGFRGCSIKSSPMAHQGPVMTAEQQTLVPHRQEAAWTPLLMGCGNPDALRDLLTWKPERVFRVLC